MKKEIKQIKKFKKLIKIMLSKNIKFEIKENELYFVFKGRREIAPPEFQNEDVKGYIIAIQNKTDKEYLKKYEKGND